MDKIISIFAVFLFFIFLISVSVVQWRLSYGLKLLVFFFSLIFAQLLFTFRTIGLDLEPYRVIFNNFDKKEINIISSFGDGLEPGFQLIIVLLKMFDVGFIGFLFVSSVIPLLVIGFVCSRSRSPLIAFLMFSLILIFKGFDVIRHFFSASIYLIALYFLSRDFKIRSFLIASTSVIFHYSSIVYLVVFPFLRVAWSSRVFGLVILLSFFLGILFRYVFLDLDIFSETSIGWKFNYYLDYLSYYKFNGPLHESLFWVINLSFYVFSLPFLFFVLLRRNRFKEERFFNVLVTSCIYGAVLCTFFIGAGAIVLGVRIHFGLSIGLFWVVAEYASYTSKRDSINSMFLPSIVVWFLISSFFIVLYNAGVHQVKSPFFITS
jgi:hypothetical protein